MFVLVQEGWQGVKDEDKGAAEETNPMVQVWNHEGLIQRDHESEEKDTKTIWRKNQRNFLTN